MEKETPTFSTKKCYECFTHLPLDAEVCPSCKRKVGKVDKIGIAAKPTDWKGYIICLLIWIGLAIFIWKGFF